MDFDELRERNALKAKQALLLKKSSPSWKDRLFHLVEYHFGEMTEWECNFCRDTTNFIILEVSKDADLDVVLTPKVKKKIKEIEATYCGSICHALNKGGIGHS